MNAAAHPIEQLHAELGDLDWVTDPSRIARLSQDYSWFSPVLKRQLFGKRAAAVVRPRTEDEIRRLVAMCARLRVPITVRGAGTGNYGQAVPLQGGVVMDMGAYNAFMWVRDGAARAQAGIRLWDMDRAARPSGLELRCMPSTFRTATLGGLFGGGFGGIGSINYGPLAARGNVLGVRAITIEEEPKFVELRGPEALLMHHMWGTNGLVLEIEIGMAPVQEWIERIVTFETLDQAMAFGDALARAPGLLKKEIAVMAHPVPAYLKQLGEFMPAGCHALFILTATASEQPLLEMVGQFQGTVTYTRPTEEALIANRSVLEFTWNHTTLNALKVDRNITYLQSAFVAGQHVEQVKKMDDLLGAEVLMHAEFIRNLDGNVTCTALQLVKFSTEERLQEIMQIYRDNGIRINDPHVFIVEDGKAGGDLPQSILDIKQRFDPHNLLNPGKVRAWMDAPESAPA